MLLLLDDRPKRNKTKQKVSFSSLLLVLTFPSLSLSLSLSLGALSSSLSLPLSLAIPYLRPTLPSSVRLFPLQARIQGLVDSSAAEWDLSGDLPGDEGTRVLSKMAKGCHSLEVLRVARCVIEDG